MANPNRLPKAILEARGNPRAASRTDAPTLTGKPEPPPWMQEEALPFFEEIVGLCHPNVLARCDGLHLAMLAESFLDYERAKAIVASEGEIAMSHTGAAYPHPAVGMRNKAHARIVAGLSKLGMNPSDRSNVAVQPEADKGKVGRFIAIA